MNVAEKWSSKCVSGAGKSSLRSDEERSFSRSMNPLPSHRLQVWKTTCPPEEDLVHVPAAWRRGETSSAGRDGTLYNGPVAKMAKGIEAIHTEHQTARAFDLVDRAGVIGGKRGSVLRWDTSVYETTRQAAEEDAAFVKFRKEDDVDEEGHSDDAEECENEGEGKWMLRATPFASISNANKCA